ncbi:MAG TPA: NHL repeat-containing protein [Ktedonobacterales bacterium]|jgi:sugar lactone lactonase YvrE
MNKRQPPDDEHSLDLSDMREMDIQDFNFPDMGSIPDPNFPDVGSPLSALPSLHIPLPEQKFTEVPQLGQFHLQNLKLDFTAGGTARGRPYKALLAIGGTGQAARTLGTAFGVALLPDGAIYVADFMDDGGQARIQVFDSSGNLVRLLRQFEVGDAQEAFDTPAALVAAQEGSLYLADMGLGCIKQIASDGQVLGVLGEEGIASNQLKAPQGIALDAAGNLCIADSGNSRVLIWDQQGRCLLILGINQPDEDGDYLQAGERPGEFDEPRGVAVDAAGNILVADTNNHRIQKFGPAGNLLQAFGEEGKEVGQLWYPERIQVDTMGAIYVSDLNGGRLQKFDASTRFVYELLLPKDAGTVADFRVVTEGHIFVALRQPGLVLKLEVA